MQFVDVAVFRNVVCRPVAALSFIEGVAPNNSIEHEIKERTAAGNKAYYLNKQSLLFE